MFVTEPFHVRTKYKYPLWSLTRKKNRLLIQTRTYLFIIASNKDKSQVPQVPIVSPNQKTSKPEWLRAIAPERVHSRFRQLKDTVAELGLHTVCEEAQCPNIGECWNGGTATVMLLDHLHRILWNHSKVAQALAEWNLDYVVLTSVDRDDILDGGADHFARTVELIKLVKPEMLVECLVGDFSGNRQSVERLATCGMESKYQQSLDMLREAKKLNPRLITKSSIMLGLGETDLEVKQTMLDLRKVGVEALTLGQYLRPTPQHLNVVEYITPERFDHWKRNGLEMGFLYVASGPLVRSSYKAGEYYMKNIIESQKNIHSYE
ncbi:Lipoyl synthase, apicoplast [Galdieria sulphuraria]|nr:Lipoyl synthase, apicoplast [Galdieria sulphuraria]